MPATPQIRIDLSSAAPVYRQIVDQIRTHAVEGVLRAGDVLPSVRRLAIDLGIHFNTVAEAYRTLAEEGWIEVAHGKAARVRSRNAPAPPEAAEVEDFRQRLRHLIAEMRAQGLSPARISRELLILAEGLKR
jgi:DNA-binding transcriptional regulator YhcF (GntR family)